jgi:hypothetical protein
MVKAAYLTIGRNSTPTRTANNMLERNIHIIAPQPTAVTSQPISTWKVGTRVSSNSIDKPTKAAIVARAAIVVVTSDFLFILVLYWGGE